MSIFPFESIVFLFPLFLVLLDFVLPCFPVFITHHFKFVSDVVKLRIQINYRFFDITNFFGIIQQFFLWQFFKFDYRKIILRILTCSSCIVGAKKDQSTVNSTNLWPLTANTYHEMIIVTCSFSKKSFFINIMFISYKFFWTILNLFSWSLNTFTKHKEQDCFLFICSFFTCCFVIILYINAVHFSILFCCL